MTRKRKARLSLPHIWLQIPFNTFGIGREFYYTCCIFCRGSQRAVGGEVQCRRRHWLAKNGGPR